MKTKTQIDYEISLASLSVPALAKIINSEWFEARDNAGRLLENISGYDHLVDDKSPMSKEEIKMIDAVIAACWKCDSQKASSAINELDRRIQNAVIENVVGSVKMYRS